MNVFNVYYYKSKGWVKANEQPIEEYKYAYDLAKDMYKIYGLAKVTIVKEETALTIGIAEGD